MFDSTWTYGDVIYHIPAKACEFSQNTILPNVMEKLESVHYSAALAVTGTRIGTSREKLHRAWLGVITFLKMKSGPYLVLQVCK